MIACAGERSGAERVRVTASDEARRLETIGRPAWWLVDAFLAAERAFDGGDSVGALKGRYASMMREALSADDVKETSPIVAFVLWRLLMLTEEPSAEDAALVFRSADRFLRKDSTAREMLEEDMALVGTSLMQFESDIWSMLAGVASKNGDVARAVVYMSAARAHSTSWSFGFAERVERQMRDGVPKETEEEIAGYLALYGFDSRIVEGSTDRFSRALWEGARLAGERRFREAAPSLWDAMESDDVNVRSQAGRRLLEVLRRTGILNEELLDLADVVVADAKRNLQQLNDGYLQSALIDRALIIDRIEGLDGAVEDLKLAAALMPPEVPAASALRYLARFHEWDGEFEKARDYYRALIDFRDVEGGNEYHRTGYYYSAHLERRSGRLSEAIRLLERLKKMSSRLDDPFYGACRFWLARLYRETERVDEASETFKDLMKKRPFSFYGLRARMHVNGGEGASGNVFLDDESAAFVATVYRNVQREVGQPRAEDRHLFRARWALDEGVYANSFKATRGLFESGQRRYHAGSPSYLGRSGELGAVAVWRSLRQDLRSSETLKNSPADRIDIAERLGTVGDWLTAHQVLHDWGTNFFQDAGYLRASYPPALRELILKASTETKVPPELLYATMYAESYFSARAISIVGALGLFQFMPSTAVGYGVGEGYPHWKNDLEGSLADEVFSVNLAARWFDDILARNEDDIILAVMEHNAGTGNVRRWFGLRGGSQSGPTCSADMESCIERARSVETRNFARKVWVAMVIAKAVGMYQKTDSVPGEES